MNDLGFKSGSSHAVRARESTERINSPPPAFPPDERWHVLRSFYIMMAVAAQLWAGDARTCALYCRRIPPRWWRAGLFWGSRGAGI